MKRCRTRFRVRYPEVDRMGIVHHACYLIWFELGRTEWMREAGLPYGELEEQGNLFFPVLEAGAKYHASAYYDEELAVETTITKLDRLRVRFEYRVLRPADDKVLCVGHTNHVAAGPGGRPRRIPRDLMEQLGART